MALPKLNETLNFTMTVPSTGKKVKFRPYLVKEEKVLLQAFESGDVKTCLEAMADTLGACIDEKSKIDVSSLATFDVEYMFLKVRSVSVGETSTVQIRCDECDEPNQVVVELDKVEVDMTDNDNVIPITESISVEMSYPTYNTLADDDAEKLADEDVDAAMKLLAKSITAILTDEERIDCRSENISEVLEFLSSMTTSQLQKVGSFLENMPSLRHKVEFECEHCKHQNDLELKGLSDFF